MYGSRGCLGCFNKPTLIITVDEPSKGRRIQGRPVKRSSFSEDFWSTSAMELDSNAIQPQRRISSMSISLDSHSTSTSSGNPPEFVNHGLLLWNQTRQQWLGNKKPTIQTQNREPRISWTATYENLLGTNKPFSQPIPLSEMIYFLVDVWEPDGLYD